MQNFIFPIWKRTENYIRLNLKQGNLEFYSPDQEVECELCSA